MVLCVLPIELYHPFSLSKNAISAESYIGGTTNTAHALELTWTQVFGQSGDRANIPNVALLITDGIPNERELDTIPQANNVKQHDIELVVVGIANKIDMNMLRVGDILIMVSRVQTIVLSCENTGQHS